MHFQKTLKSLFALFAITLFFTSCFHEDNRINMTCFDEILNQEEEFVDCGGPNCEPCPPTCDNGILDYVEGWQEWGVDCGGPCETCCENGVWDVNPIEPALSEEWTDCGGTACEPCETCNNGEHDPGEETMIGGVLYDAIDCDDDPTTEECLPCVELCDDGLLNGVEEPCIDCGGACEPCDFAYCENGVLDEFPNNPDQNETDIDCGGCGCPDCESLCNDGILNGNEEALDCGGGICPTCDDLSLCSDGVQNGYETGIDCYDGTATNESACEPCSALCSDGILNGNETDTDAISGCGGADCPPCAVDNQNFMTYTVTTDTEDHVFYESVFSTVALTSFTPGLVADPEDHDVIVFQGGAAHVMQFTIQDTDVQDMNMGANTYLLNNTAITALSLSNVILVTNDGLTFQSKFSPEGITVTNFMMTVTGFGTPFEEIILTGSFSGTLSDGLGNDCDISNGNFSILL